MGFLFLSKLLPLFIYPLGLACILLLFALFLCFKHSRWVFIPVSLALAILLIAGNMRVSNNIIKSLEWQYLPQGELPSAEAMVVLGGATRSIDRPRILPDLLESGDRLLYAAKLYQDGKAPLIILSGGRITWKGGEGSEAQDMATILEIMGVPKEAMILEPKSLNTYQNAVYTKQILEAKGIKEILLITSAAHMPRSLAIFKKQGIKAIAAPTDFLVSELDISQANYSSEGKIISLLPEAEYLYATTRVLKEYIGTLVYRLRGWL